MCRCRLSLPTATACTHSLLILCSPLPFDHNGKRQDNKFEIFADRLALKIGDIHIDHNLEGHPTPSVDLPGTCQSRLPSQAQFIVVTILLDFVRKRWTRANE